VSNKNDNNETESPDIIEEIIPGKNNDSIDKSINQNNNNNQQSLIENYNEHEAAQAVIETSEESKRTVERNTIESGNQFPRDGQTISDIQKHTAQTSREISESYLELQKQAINSFQTVFMPYFHSVQDQLWNNQEYFKSISGMYFRLASNYTESVFALSRMWNDIAFTNASLFKPSANKPGPTDTKTHHKDRG